MSLRARASAALSGLTVAESFRDGKVAKQKVEMTSFSLLIIFPLYTGGFRGFCPVGTHALCSRLSAYPFHRNGSYAGTHYFYQIRLYHFGTGYLCACRRLDGPGAAATFSHLDATTVLSRKIFELGIFPRLIPSNHHPAF